MKMNKMTLLGTVVLVIGSGALFASGQGERPSNVEPGRRLTAEAESVTLTGTVEYRDQYPVLVADGTAYSLSTRGGGWYADDLKEGMELTVAGDRIEALDDSPSGADYHLFVATATADGETIEFDAPGNRRGGAYAARSDEDEFTPRGGGARGRASADARGGGNRRRS